MSTSDAREANQKSRPVVGCAVSMRKSVALSAATAAVVAAIVAVAAKLLG